MADEPIPEMCANCKYCVDGQCRRNPPAIIVLDDIPDTMWPEVHPLGWCGEFKDVDDDKVKVEVESSPK